MSENRPYPTNCLNTNLDRERVVVLGSGEFPCCYLSITCALSHLYQAGPAIHLPVTLTPRNIKLSLYRLAPTLSSPLYWHQPQQALSSFAQLLSLFALAEPR